MFRLKYPTEQSDPPLSPRETLPTMYDLPSEDPEEPGLPDQFHDYQPELLGLTFRPANCPEDMVFTASDLNIYYDVHHQNWYKRPDWFAVLGVSKLYDGHDLRLSYVIWQEGVAPYIAIELLSPGTEKEDLGERELANYQEANYQENGYSRKDKQPPSKWKVYEQILKIPYYVVFSRYTNQLRLFNLRSQHYQEVQLTEPKVWLPEIKLGLGLWEGEYRGIHRLWLRWYDSDGNWLLTDTERLELVEQEMSLVEQRAESAEQRAESAEQRAESAEQRAAYLAQRLRELGIDI